MKIRYAVAFTLMALFLMAGTLSAGQDDVNLLRERAEKLWQARVDENWKQVYDIIHPQEKSEFSVEQFIVHKKEKGPFRYLSYKINDVAVSEDIGWIEVTYRIRTLAYPKMPSEEITAWKIWQKDKGLWYPMPHDQLSKVPQRPPHMRPAKEEALLTKRADEFWEAREKQNLKRIYDYLDPDFRSTVPEEEFLQKKSLFNYLTHKVKWAEVKDNRAMVMVVYTYKMNDPSLSKLDPGEESTIDEWIKKNDQWYFFVPKKKEKKPDKGEDK